MFQQRKTPTLGPGQFLRDRHFTGGPPIARFMPIGPVVNILPKIPIPAARNAISKLLTR